MPAFMKIEGIDGGVSSDSFQFGIEREMKEDVVGASTQAAGISHGVTVLAWARVDGVAPLDARDDLAADPPEPDMGSGFVGGWGSSQYQYAFEG